MGFPFQRQQGTNAVVAIGPGLGFIANHIARVKPTWDQSGHSIQILATDETQGDKSEVLIQAMGNQPDNTVLVLNAHKFGPEPDHFVKLGMPGEAPWKFPALRLLERISEARDGRSFDCLFNTCAAGELHDRVHDILPKGSLFITLSKGDERTFQYEVGAMLRTSAQSPLTRDSFSADRLLLSYLAVADKRWWATGPAEPQITIVGTDFDAGKLTASVLGTPLTPQQKMTVQSLLGQTLDQSKPLQFLPALLAAMEAGHTDVQMIGENGVRHAGPQALAVALAAQYDLAAAVPVANPLADTIGIKPRQAADGSTNSL